MKWGASGPFRVMHKMGIKIPPLIGSQSCEICEKYMADDKLVDKIKKFLVKEGIHTKMREQLRQPLTKARSKILKKVQSSGS